MGGGGGIWKLKILIPSGGCANPTNTYCCSIKVGIIGAVIPMKCFVITKSIFNWARSGDVDY